MQLIILGKEAQRHTPFIGPILQTLNASARYSSVTISLTVPGALLIIAAAKNAAKAVNVGEAWLNNHTVVFIQVRSVLLHIP